MARPPPSSARPSRQCVLPHCASPHGLPRCALPRPPTPRAHAPAPSPSPAGPRRDHAGASPRPPPALRACALRHGGLYVVPPGPPASTRCRPVLRRAPPPRHLHRGPPGGRPPLRGGARGPRRAGRAPAARHRRGQRPRLLRLRRPPPPARRDHRAAQGLRHLAEHQLPLAGAHDERLRTPRIRPGLAARDRAAGRRDLLPADVPLALRGRPGQGDLAPCGRSSPRGPGHEGPRAVRRSGHPPAPLQLLDAPSSSSRSPTSPSSNTSWRTSARWASPRSASSSATGPTRSPR
ncbi:hypothetical protein STANM309S_03405 [Streptomyces tanashiensis]